MYPLKMSCSRSLQAPHPFVQVQLREASAASLLILQHSLRVLLARGLGNRQMRGAELAGLCSLLVQVRFRIVAIA